MTREEISEGNKLIADFMEFPCPPKYHDPESDEGGVGYYHPSELGYHSEWNELMPVVEKIESINTDFKTRTRDYSVDINGQVVRITGFNMNKPIAQVLGNSHTKIQATHKAVVEFIKWYNQK